VKWIADFVSSFMLKILPAAEIRALDAYTIKHRPIASIDLMERACRAFTKAFAGLFDNRYTVAIVCGTGNNGGDGVGIARLLNDMGYRVVVYVVRGSATPSIDFQINHDRARRNHIKLVDFDGENGGLNLDGSDVIIDAVFGSGLSRPAEGIYAKAIASINLAAKPTVAVDIPSGLMTDGLSKEPIVKASYTISFQLPKLAFLLPESHRFVGYWSCVDIGLDKSFIKRATVRHFLIRPKDARKWLRPRSIFDHKGTFGHALIIAGSAGKIGAAVLSGRAAMRAGVGLLTVHVPSCGYGILQTALPEAMVSVDANEAVFSAVPDISKYTAVGIGPGLGVDDKTARALGDILPYFDKPIVIDADALNILASERELLHMVPRNSIITPHPGEFRRLVGSWSDDFEKLEKLRDLARRLTTYVVLKGAYTTICSPDGTIYFNSTGNPGMATGGSGDVLTGVITALLAQGYDSLTASLLGVYVHGLAGDLALPDRGMKGMIASDIVETLPAAFRHLENA
jgi:NAD(P)H-hydrate epimerase